MNKMQSHRLVEDYLRRLDRAAAHLQRARRLELVSEIRQHIESALGEEEAANDAAVLNVLERLGRPEEIVEAADPDPRPVARPGWLEITALVALVVPFLGWLVGIVLVAASSVWSRRDKVVGGALLLLPLLLLGLSFTSSIGTSGMEESVPPGDDRPVGLKEPGPSGGPGPAELYLFGAGVPSAVFLGWRLRDRRSESPS